MRSKSPVLLCLLGLTSSLLASSASAEPTPSSAPQLGKGSLVKIDKGTLHFQGYEPIQTSWAEIEYIGQLSPAGHTPYAMVLAKPCQNCIEERSVQMLRLDGDKRLRFMLPGKVREPKTGSVIVESRSFYGECLPGMKDIVVSYQKDIVDKRRYKRRYRSTEPSYLVVEPQADGTIREKLNELRSLGQLAAKERQTLVAVKQKRCFEIPGKDRRITAKMMNLRPSNDEDDVEDEDAAEEKLQAKAPLPGSPDTQSAEPTVQELGVPTLSAPR